MFELEIREKEGVLTGVMLQEGRAATGGRREVFAPGSVEWSAEGVGIKTVHLGEVETRATVERTTDGRLKVTAPATEKVKAAFQEGKRFLSVEFVALAQTVTKGGVREIQRAFVDSAALVRNPEYNMSLAEIRRDNLAPPVPQVDDRKYRIWL